MTSTLPSAVDSDVPALLRLLLQQFKGGDDAGRLETMGELGSHRLARPETIVGALCLGGVDFAASLVAHGQTHVERSERYALVLDAFNAILEAPQGAPDEHEAQVAAWLVECFGLPVSAAALLETVRAEFLITAGPINDVQQAALAAARLGEWELALRGFVRYQKAAQHATPRKVYGMASMCLHRLGRYEEAERWALQGLGERQRALLAIGPVHPEAELLRQWEGRETPVISILCTSYNHERYIEKAIRGFLSQNCSFSFEVLIHDDASQDKSQEIIRHWQKQYPKVIRTVLQTENQFSQGVRPFELLLAQARGEFVATCEGDDFWVDPAKLQRQVGFLAANPDYSCSAHNYHHYVETALTVTPWLRSRRDHVLSERDLMGVRRLLWWPTLVFRKTFTALPPERALSPIGDQFVTSYLGTKGRCMYFESLLGAVRRENDFSIWSPLSEAQKERIRIKTWEALICLHENMGNPQAVADLRAKIAKSLDANKDSTPLPDESTSLRHTTAAAAT